MSQQVKVTKKSDNHYVFEGVIDEESDFTESVKNFQDNVSIDFSSVTRINSCGVRQWVTAISKFNSKIVYVNVPSQIVDQFSMVPEFLGTNSMVSNFNARYICEACGNEENQNLVVGKHIKPCLDDYPEGPKLACGKCNSEMEMDHNSDVYLEFLKYVKP